ncbi:Hypothetical predicted protein, partial [Pelobates cultripes]
MEEKFHGMLQALRATLQADIWGITADLHEERCGLSRRPHEGAHKELIDQLFMLETDQDKLPFKETDME